MYSSESEPSKPVHVNSDQVSGCAAKLRHGTAALCQCLALGLLPELLKWRARGPGGNYSRANLGAQCVHNSHESSDLPWAHNFAPQAQDRRWFAALQILPVQRLSHGEKTAASRTASCCSLPLCQDLAKSAGGRFSLICGLRRQSQAHNTFRM